MWKKLNYRKIVLMLADVFILCIAGIIANFVLNLFPAYTMPNTQRVFLGILLSVFFGYMGLFVCNAYTKLWRTFRLRDYLSCVLGTVIGLGIAALVCLLVERPLPLLFWAEYILIAMIGIVLFRLLFRRTFLSLTGINHVEAGKRTLVIGAGEAGAALIREMQNGAPPRKYWPVCIADDDTGKLHNKLHQVPIAGRTQDIPRLCKEYEVESIMLAIPSLPETERQQILSICEETGLAVKVIPYIGELLFKENENLLPQMRDIRMEDLLGRPPITFDNHDIRKLVTGKVCMVTGGGGSIGSELCRQIARYEPKQLIILDIYENNAYEIQQELKMEHGDRLDLVTLISSVRDYDKMRLIFDTYRPQIVFHAAAHKHVPLMETVPEEAVKNNVGTYNVSSLANEFGVDKFVLISTDKAVNPTNVMGATKRCCEMVIQYQAQHSRHTEFATVRFGNVLGSNGSVIPLFRRQIENGKPVTITHRDIIRYFMTIPEAVSLVLQAGALAKGGEIFVLDMGKPVKILTLAENLIRQYGKEPYTDVPIVFTGLRPGEKLYEELLMAEEGLQSTSNKKIFIGNQIAVDNATFEDRLTRLRACAESNNSDETVQMLSELVPTFHHQTHKEDNKDLVVVN
jgi:FlaA1/EpsC-like NDP-sugar epimerase